MRPRRIVTGHDEAGRSVVLSDGPPPSIARLELVAGVESTGEPQPTPPVHATFVEIWKTREMPAVIASREPEPTEGAIRVPPAANGTIVRLVEFEAGSRSPIHRTETVDYGVVVEGEIFLVLDDSEVHLEVGSVVVQRGTDHAWENRSDNPAVMLFVLVDARFSTELRSVLPPDAIAGLYNAPLTEGEG
jgi:quercetin dioxygenase-like cupin family protein